MRVDLRGGTHKITIVETILRARMELDVLAHSHSVPREHLQRINKQKEIELYYELLSSGTQLARYCTLLAAFNENPNTAT